MNKIRLITIALFFAFSLINSVAFSAQHNSEIIVESAYIRATIPGTDITSAYMSIKNNSDGQVILIGASSSVSDRIEIHQHTMADGMMKMRQVTQLTIKEKQQVVFQPMGYHFMIFNVKTVLQPKLTPLLQQYFFIYMHLLYLLLSLMIFFIMN